MNRAVQSLVLVALAAVLTACGPGGRGDHPIDKVQVAEDSEGRTYLSRSEQGESYRPSGRVVQGPAEGEPSVAIALGKDGIPDGPFEGRVDLGDYGSAAHKLMGPRRHIGEERRKDVSRVAGRYGAGRRQGEWVWTIELEQTPTNTLHVARVVERYGDDGRVAEFTQFRADGSVLYRERAFEDLATLRPFADVFRVNRVEGIMALVQAGRLDINQPIPEYFEEEKQGEAQPYSHIVLKAAPRDIRKLVESGADASAVDSRGNSVLSVCLQGFPRYCSEDDFLWLVGKGAEVDAATPEGLTPLMRLADSANPSVPAIKALLAEGADPNRFAKLRDGRHATPIFLAARQGGLEAFRVLLEHPATDLSKGRSDGESAAVRLASERWSTRRGGPRAKEERQAFEALRRALLRDWAARAGGLPATTVDGEPFWMSAQATTQDDYRALIAALREAGVDLSARNKAGRDFSDEMLARGNAWAL